MLAKLRTILAGRRSTRPAGKEPSLSRFPRRGQLVGSSFDPTTGLLYVNSNNVVNIITLVESSEAEKARSGPYRFTGYKRFLDHEGYPAIKPPWGQLNAINLNTGEFAWRVPLGEHVELTARGVPRTGTETFGGSIVTAGGLVFIGGTKDERIHAFDKKTGQLLGNTPAGRRLRDSGDLRGRWSPIRGYRGRWRRQAANEGWRRVCGVLSRRAKMIDGPARESGKGKCFLPDYPNR